VLPEENNEKPPCASNGSTIHGFSIRRFTLRGFDKHGLHLACVNGFLIDENVAENNGVYGIFPVLSRDGVLTNNTVRGTVRDAGVYVGQSDFVLIAGKHDPSPRSRRLCGNSRAKRRAAPRARATAGRTGGVAASTAAVSHGERREAEYRPAASAAADLAETLPAKNPAPERDRL
jgi:parallel beta-helix repeat protein